MRRSMGSISSFFAISSTTLSTAYSEIGAPGARYAATFGRLETTSYPMTFTFSMSYGAYAHMTPGCTGEPWNAPAWYFSSAYPATNLPSFVAPILTWMVAPDVG